MAVDSVSNTGTNAASNQAQQKLSGDYQSFLKLLTTQLQHQDPTRPADTNQITQEIAMLSQVEQQIATNRNLEQLTAMYQSTFLATQSTQLIGNIGKQIDAGGNQGALFGGDARFAYVASKEPKEITVTIKNSEGAVVYKATGKADTNGFVWDNNDHNGTSIPGSPVLGRNEFFWNGKNNDGKQQPEGIYTISVTAKDSEGTDIAMQTLTTGIVTSVTNLNGISYVEVGGPTGFVIPPNNINRVSIPTHV